VTERMDPTVRQLSKALKKADIEFERQPFIGALQPDFLVHGPAGQSAVIQVTDWDPRGGNTAKAAEQADYFRTATGSTHSLFVLPDLGRNYQHKAVGTDRVVPTLLKLFQELEETPAGEPGLKHATSSRIVFAAMPFDRKYNDTHRVMIAACEKADVVCKRVDSEVFSGSIIEKIKKLIRKSNVVIVDLSDAKPNVLYEAGFAHALRKPSIHITSTPDNMPFHVSTSRWLAYEVGDAGAIEDELTKNLKALTT